MDNRPCLDLIEGRTSVFSLMNEVTECFVQDEFFMRFFSQMDGNVFLILVSQALIKAYYFSNVKAPEVF